MLITDLIGRKRSTQQTHIIVELESVVYDIRNKEHEIEKEFNFYLGNVTAELFQLVSINQIEVRDLQNGQSLRKSKTTQMFVDPKLSDTYNKL